MICFSSAGYNMFATVLPGGQTKSDTPTGRWERQQDPDTGSFVDVWVEYPAGSTPDGVDTEDNWQDAYEIECAIRGYHELGYRSSANLEMFKDEAYRIDEYLEMKFPPFVVLTRQDKITNIRNKANVLIWIEEERATDPATVFSVNGITPQVNPFGDHVSNLTVLKRSSVQNATVI